jgi:Family of unknown function (DUF6488)
MKHFVLTVSLAALFSAVPPVFASEGGSCHFHGNKPIAEATVIGCASQRKDTLISVGKLDKSWLPIKPEKIEMTESKNGKEWKVTFRDAAAQDKSKQALYMFFTPAGNFVAANFTGQ